MAGNARLVLEALSGRLDRPALAAVTVVRIAPDATLPWGWRLVVAVDPARAVPRVAMERAIRSEVGDVPLRLEAALPASRSGAILRLPGKRERHADMVGGLLIRVPRGTVGTTCVVVRQREGQREGQRDGRPAGRRDERRALCVVTAGHVVGEPGVPVYQPGPETGEGNRIGTALAAIGASGTAASDSALIALTRQDARTGRIWAGPGRLYRVVGAGETEPGERVAMQGAAIALGERTGLVAATGATVRFADGGRLTGQILATYESREGDSGAPVYRPAATDAGRDGPAAAGDAGAVTLIGLNVGAAQLADLDDGPGGTAVSCAVGPGGFAVVSPWAAVAADLGGLSL